MTCAHDSVAPVGQMTWATPVESTARAFPTCSSSPRTGGGHFAAPEEPESLAKNMRECFRPFRSAVAG